MADRKKVPQLAMESAMRYIPMIGEGADYRQRLDDFKAGYMAGHDRQQRYMSELEQKIRKAFLVPEKLLSKEGNDGE